LSSLSETRLLSSSASTRDIQAVIAHGVVNPPQALVSLSSESIHVVWVLLWSPHNHNWRISPMSEPFFEVAQVLGERCLVGFHREPPHQWPPVIIIWVQGGIFKVAQLSLTEPLSLSDASSASSNTGNPLRLYSQSSVHQVDSRVVMICFLLFSVKLTTTTRKLTTTTCAKIVLFVCEQLL